MMKRSKAVGIAAIAILSSQSIFAQNGRVDDNEVTSGQQARSNIGPALDGPAILTPRTTQAMVTGGSLTLNQLRRKGLEMFTTPFNQQDGHGDGPSVQGSAVFGERPTTNGTWLRMNGLDSQTCQECHAFVSNATIPPILGIGGIAGIANSAFPGVTDMDVTDADGNNIADVNGRLINPPFLFGAGGIELLGKEMTVELQNLKAQAQANPGSVVALTSKGTNFGSISYDAMTGFDLSNVEGIDDDLAVRPFGRKGEFITVRDFDVGAAQFHLGMQAAELVGTGVDGDNDGVTDELLVGELSVMHIFGTTLEQPVEVFQRSRRVRAGRLGFGSAGCSTCHSPQMRTNSRDLDLSFPEVATDPSANVYYTIDLTTKAPGFQSVGGGVRVALFSDLKRHDLGPALAETTGNPGVDEFFITPRLWGIADTAPYLHDGRALTIRDAIDAHAGEAQFANDNFNALSSADQDQILTFLNSLRTPTNPAAGINTPVRR